MNTVIFNGHLYANDHTSILNIADRCFRYGDGLFETIIHEGREMRFFNDHFERLSLGMAALKMQNKLFDIEQLSEEITNLMRANNHKGMARIRLQVWRKAGGLYTPDNNNINYLMESSDFKYQNQASGSGFPYISYINVCFSSSISLSYSKLSSLKTCNSLPYIVASIEKNERMADDIIIPDTQGNIAESASSNIFWLRDGIIYTPSIESGCIAGVMRKNILRIFKEASIDVKEVLMPLYEIEHSEIIFLTNVTGIRLIKQLEQKTYDDEALKAFINSYYFSSIQQLF